VVKEKVVMMVRRSFVYERRKSVASTEIGFVGPMILETVACGVIAYCSNKAHQKPYVDGKYKL